MCKSYKKGRKKRRDASDDEAETSADESRADPGTGESEQTASAAGGNVGKRHKEGGDSTDYGGDQSPDDAGQTTGRWSRRAGRDEGGTEQRQDFAEISRRMYEEIRSSRDPRDHVEDG